MSIFENHELYEKTRQFMEEVEAAKKKFDINTDSAAATFILYKLAEIEMKLEQIESKK